VVKDATIPWGYVCVGKSLSWKGFGWRVMGRRCVLRVRAKG